MKYIQNPQTVTHHSDNYESFLARNAKVIKDYEEGRIDQTEYLRQMAQNTTWYNAQLTYKQF